MKRLIALLPLLLLLVGCQAARVLLFGDSGEGGEGQPGLVQEVLGGVMKYGPYGALYGALNFGSSLLSKRGRKIVSAGFNGANPTTGEGTSFWDITRSMAATVLLPGGTSVLPVKMEKLVTKADAERAERERKG